MQVNPQNNPAVPVAVQNNQAPVNPNAVMNVRASDTANAGSSEPTESQVLPSPKRKATGDATSEETDSTAAAAPKRQRTLVTYSGVKRGSVATNDGDKQKIVQKRLKFSSSSSDSSDSEDEAKTPATSTAQLSNESKDKLLGKKYSNTPASVQKCQNPAASPFFEAAVPKSPPNVFTGETSRALFDAAEKGAGVLTTSSTPRAAAAPKDSVADDEDEDGMGSPDFQSEDRDGKLLQTQSHSHGNISTLTNCSTAKPSSKVVTPDQRDSYIGTVLGDEVVKGAAMKFKDAIQTTLSAGKFNLGEDGAKMVYKAMGESLFDETE